MKLIPLIFFIIFSILCINIKNSQSLSFETIGNVVKSGKDVATGAVSKLPSLIPKPESLLQMGKNLLAGYPFEVIFDAINKLCSVALSANAVRPKYTPDVHKMTFVLMTPTKNYSYPLVNAEELWHCPAFDKNKATVVLVTGWTTDLNGTNGCIYTMSKAYFCRGNVNFVVLDPAQYIDTLYTWSAFNTEEIGNYVGQALILFSQNADYNKIHLIGHSLGAHIVGAAGRSFTKHTGLSLPRITGLDPAKPCFNEGESLTGLQRGDANFIDVIHSNPGALGKEDSTGDVDFYPGGLNPLPSGCLTITCAHERAWRYYAETVLPGYEYNFMALKCNSLATVKSGACHNGNEIPMGYATPLNARGNYFLEVNSESPYGKNSTSKNYHCN